MTDGALDKVFGGVDIQRFGNQIALNLFTTKLGDLCQLFSSFYAFGDDIHLQIVGQGRNGAYNFIVLAIAVQPPDKGLVNFQRINGQTMQIAERRIAGAKVIQL